jgi:hypothetical protein
MPVGCRRKLSVDKDEYWVKPLNMNIKSFLLFSALNGGFYVYRRGMFLNICPVTYFAHMGLF